MTDLAGTETVTEASLEPFRRELTAYSYRMLGSAFEAEDAVQETMVRAWRGLDRFEGRAALRSWLYRITTNVCLDMLKSRERRARPMDVSPLGSSNSALGEALGESAWVQPIPDRRIMPETGDPAEAAVLRETVNLAFMAVLQHLPPKQRAVLILREVLQWRATEVAELLETTVASVNSALQRARATLAENRPEWAGGSGESDEDGPLLPAPQAPEAEDQRDLLARYVDAFERYDMKALVAVLHEDATLSMPPYALWMRGHADIVGWMLGTGHECEGSRLVATSANGSAAFGQYRPSGPNGEYEPWALQVIEVHEGKVSGLNTFLDTASLFPMFGLPPTLDA